MTTRKKTSPCEHVKDGSAEIAYRDIIDRISDAIRCDDRKNENVEVGVKRVIAERDIALETIEEMRKIFKLISTYEPERQITLLIKPYVQ